MALEKPKLAQPDDPADIGKVSGFNGTAIVWTSSSGSGLPDGVIGTDGFTATTGTSINPATSTTGWVKSFGGTGPTAGTPYGVPTIFGNIQTQATYRMYVNLPSAVPVGVYTNIVFDLRWQGTGGFLETSLADWAVVKAASGVDFTGTVVTGPPPFGPYGTFLPVSIDLDGLTSVRSIGLEFTASQGSGASIDLWFGAVRFGNKTELDEALLDQDPVAVLLSPGYAPSVTQELFSLPSTKTIIDLRPTNTYLSHLNGVRHLREWAVPEDAATDVTGDLARAVGEMRNGETLLFPAGGFFKVEKTWRITDKRNITIDLNGSTIFTTVFRGGDNNTGDTMVAFLRCRDVKFRNGLVVGWHDRPRTGDTLTADGGTPTVVSTTMALDGLGDIVRNANSNGTLPFYARHPLVSFPTPVRALITAYDPDFSFGNVFLVNLSDTAHVASDCVVEVVAGDDNSVLATRTLTLTATPTDYVITYTPADLHRVFKCRVRKATATTNTISVNSMTEYGLTRYEGTHDSASAFIADDTQRLTIEDLIVEGAATDAFDFSNATLDRLTLRRVKSLKCSRQGMSFNQGTNFLVQDFEIGEAGRSGIDVEPYTETWFVRGIKFLNGRIYNATNYSFAILNWPNVFDLEIDGVEAFGSGGWITGGGRQSSIRNSGGEGVAEINGQDLRVDNVWFTGDLRIGTDERIFNGQPVTTDNIVVNGATLGGWASITGGRNNRLENIRSSARVVDGFNFGVSSPRNPGNFYTSHRGVEYNQWPLTFKGPVHSQTPFVKGGQNFKDEALVGVRSISGKRNAPTTVLASTTLSATGTSSSVDLGTRGRSGFLRLWCNDKVGTTAVMYVVVQGSQNNSNWYDIAILDRINTIGQLTHADITYLERYVRLSYTLTGTTSLTLEAALDLAGPAGANLGEVAVAVTTSATTKAVTFPAARLAPTFSPTGQIGAGITATGGALSPSTTYYYRVSARSRDFGPASWSAEFSVTTGGAHNGVELQLTNYLWTGAKGLYAEGFTVLRGTSTGVYTTRFDVLMPPSMLVSNGRRDTQWWNDLGTKIAANYAYPDTYPTTAGPFTVADETGWEPDANYGVVITPSWGTTAWVTAKTTAGFTANFGTAAPGGATFDYMIVR